MVNIIVEEETKKLDIVIDTYNPNHNNRIYTTDDNHGNRKKIIIISAIMRAEPI